jgi:beta-lactam-binding protein with PASTA domain/tRNA A-37 threonylcarbamoyl transferase component Bud32
MAVSDTLIDSLFDGRYRIVRKLGTGGMANVYLAEDQELGRRVAIKILDDRHASDDQFVERFRREAKNAAGLNHPNIVSIYDRGEAEGTYYIAMEYLDGRSLKELIVSRGPAPINVAIDYARQILAALRFAHRNSIVHRDIKPHNVLVDRDGRLKVTDFGIARAGASEMTEAGSIIGTAQYLSPEQAKGTAVDHRSDIYSVGVVLYELVTGRVPFTGDTAVEIAMRHLSSVPEPPSDLRDDVPHELDMVILRALAKDPDDRYQTAEQMDAELERVSRGLPVSQETEDAATMILSGTGIPADATTVIRPTGGPRPPVYAPPPPVYYEEPPPHRRTVWPWLLALVLLAGAAVAGWYVYKQVQGQLNSSKPIAVPYVVGIREPLAYERVRAAGLTPVISRQFTTAQPETYVYNQDPKAGNRIDKGNQVTIFVSEGPPKTTVPEEKGKNSLDAVQDLNAANLKAKVVNVPSNQPADTVLAQDPPAGTKVKQGTVVRINVSKGPQPVTVPDVTGLPYDQAAAQLGSVGFKVTKAEVESDQPAGTVLAETPPASSSATKGSTITLSVSKGPTNAQVPDVTSQDPDTATATLEASQFKVQRTQQDVNDPNLDNTVISQDPPGGAQAKSGSTVTIVVGHYTGG